jgi:hypothetical protein
MALAFFGGLVRGVAVAAAAALAAGPGPIWPHAMGAGLVGAALAALLAPAVFAVLAWEKRQLGLT